MTILTSPMNPSRTPLPWRLVQTQNGNYFFGSKGQVKEVIARTALSEDATLIFHAVHTYRPMLFALQLLKSKLYINRGCMGGTSLSAQFNHRELLIILNALAIAEREGNDET